MYLEKEDYMNVRKISYSSLAAGALLLATVAPALAASTVVVTPTNQQGWSTADTRPGGAVNFVFDPTSPAPTGALQLTTDLTTAAKAQYLHAASTPLAQVQELSYYTKQNSASFPQGDPSYQLPVMLNGASGFTTLVFEPYQNVGNNGNTAVVPGAWQKWDVAAGLFWSSRTVTCVNGVVLGTPGGPATYTLAQLQSLCPSAQVVGFGVNIGSNNPGYDVQTDLVNFNGTTYDFEQYMTPKSKDDCKNDGSTRTTWPRCRRC